MKRCTCEIARREARLEALEEAAQIADDLAGKFWWVFKDETFDMRDEGRADGALAAAEAIRALKEAK